MALFTNLDLGVVKPLDLKDYKPTIGESMSIAWDAAMEQNPMQILARRQEMAGWEDGLELFDSRTGLDPTVDIDFEDFRLGREVHALPLEEQARQIKDAGLEGQVKPVEGYRQEALDIVMDSKRLENAAGLVSENQGLGGAVAGFGAGLAASFMDPINIASAFVPVAGEARVMSLMAGASGIGQRAAIRAGLGAASGALGAAMIEPMIYLGQQEVQADYTFANSMLNMSFGAIMGGVMHAGGGTFAEWRRARSGKAQPWEYVPPDDDSQALMQAHADDMARYEIEANPEANADFIREHALAEAELFNQKARAWAYHERKTVGEYYAQNRPEYRSWRDYFEPPKVDDGTGFEWRPDDVPSEVDTLKIKVDIPLEKGWNKYKDHKISKIEIAPSLYRDSGGNNISGAAQNQSAISGISLSVLKGDVKPSRIENNTLFQSTPSRSIVGKQTQILGANSKEIGRYEVREMDDVIASHDPENQFRRRENYPQEAQERPYHSDEGEQQKVVGNALNYEPAFVVSTDASATNGPPIITQNGIVLGGNSRTMTLQMVYGQHPEKAAAYRQALVDNASQFGIDPQAIANMKRPMLVRVVSGQFSPEDMAKRSREYNQTTTTREPAPMSDPDANLPPELQAEPQVQSPRGQVQFDAETGRAVVTFFQSADVSTAPHELFHIFRREMERTALAADGSAHAREQWRKACEFVGAKDGQAWSREMEEKFANAGLQYLREGRAPTPGLRGLFERLKTWFMDLYQKAEDLGVEISPQMREVFDGMFTVPYDAADRSFRYAMGDIHSRQVERDFADPATSGGRFAAEDQRLLDAEKSGDAALVDQLMRDAQVRADEAVRRLEQSSPELRGLVDEANLEIAEIDRQIEHNNIRDEFRRQALECQWNGG